MAWAIKKKWENEKYNFTTYIKLTTCTYCLNLHCIPNWHIFSSTELTSPAGVPCFPYCSSVAFNTQKFLSNRSYEFRNFSFSYSSKIVFKGDAFWREFVEIIETAHSFSEVNTACTLSLILASTVFQEGVPLIYTRRKIFFFVAELNTGYVYYFLP